MFEGVRQVVGPRGEALREEDLPDRGTTRWVARRKAEVVAAVNGGLLTAKQACDRYQMSLEELVSWQRAVDRDGVAGLRVGQAQQLRMRHERTERARAFVG
jgi:hypothetical protein